MPIFYCTAKAVELLEEVIESQTQEEAEKIFQSRLENGEGTTVDSWIDIVSVSENRS